MMASNSNNESQIVKILKSSDISFFLLITVGAILLFLSLINMYFLTPPFPKGPGGFTVSGHPVFYMISEAFVAFSLFTIASVASILFLFTRNLKYDAIVIASAKTGILASSLTLLIGIFWSKVEWGYYWQWEARQTMTLIMFIFYVGMVLFRSTVDDIIDKAKLTAVFGLVAFPTVPMTNFIIGGLHPDPQQSLSSGSSAFMGAIFMFIGTFLIYIAFLYMTYVIEKANNKLEEYKFFILAKQE